MTKKAENKIESEKWEKDLFSTIFSRKHSFHLVIGKERYTKIKKSNN